MTADQEDGTVDGTSGRAGDRRGTDRRGGNRRQQDRRAPPPVWRRPWALVSYGVVGALALVLLVNGLRGGDDHPVQGAVVNAPPVAPAPTPPSRAAAAAPVEDAYGAAGFEKLTIQGQAAVGRRVRTELFCDAPATVALNTQVTEVESAVAALRDAEGRVPGALCQWGSRGDARREDFLLLIPPALAADFAAAPVTTDDFVRRRRLVAEVEWIGPSQALALRTAGVLRRVYPR